MRKEKKDQQIVLGRILKALDEEEDEGGEDGEDGEKEKHLIDEVDPADYFYINVIFSINCTYKSDCETNKAFMDGVETALNAEQQQRDKEQKNKN